VSETPTPPEPERTFPRFPPPRHAIKAAVGLLGCRWWFTCLVAAAFLLGGLGWLLTFSILPRFEVVAPWLKSVSDGVVLVSAVPLVVLSYLLPEQKEDEGRPSRQ
jgi:hypothetical protein